LVREASKACARLGWQPETSFKELEVMIVEAELNVLRKGVSYRLAQSARKAMEGGERSAYIDSER
jgi:hypothetical protein